MTKNNNKNLAKTYDLIAKEFSNTRKLFWPEWSFFSRFLDNFSNKEKISILDVGCGNGRFLKFLQEIKHLNFYYQGFDISKKLLEEAQKSFPEVSFTKGNMTSLPYQDNSFDILASIASFHHLKNIDERKNTLKEFYRVLKPNGILLIMVWNLWHNDKYQQQKEDAQALFDSGQSESSQDFNITWGKEKINRYYYAFQLEELKNLLLNSGLEIEFLDYSDRKNIGVAKNKALNIIAVCQKK